MITNAHHTPTSLADGDDFVSLGATRRQTGGRVGLHINRDDPLSVVCWCEREVFTLTVGDVLDGQTRTCGRRYCKAPSHAG